ncbi:hypothetical protein D2V93_15125 [Flagellimonas taeanensis]|uniref:hypothetical protein n=1 Tax=Flavobacteriaceae TaxID=49546 RepID=UPI000E694594|nr:MULTISPECIES: hypothetical protein [Allomuricauda]MDC6384884.1 hypothetical protein [Muricauda sp. SK9]RIV49134.1 hypothetical protein D2V93_15125 [Allomuricauda taeanensis]
MKNNKYRKIGILFAIVALVISSCEEERIVYDPVSGQTLASFNTSSVNLGVPVEGASAEVIVTASTESDVERTISVEVDPASTATPDQYTISNSGISAGEFAGVITVQGNFDALPEEGTTKLILNLTDVSNSNDLTFGNKTLAVTLFRQCDSAPTPGIWTINMEDSYGDGWQTTTGDGGSGITITLSDGTVFEVGLCTPYEGSDYDCTGFDTVYDSSNRDWLSGTATIEIPEGIESAEWFFPGDNWEEISFSIVAPNGNTVAQGGPGTPAGPIEIDFCAQ